MQKSQILLSVFSEGDATQVSETADNTVSIADDLAINALER